MLQSPLGPLGTMLLKSDAKLFRGDDTFSQMVIELFLNHFQGNMTLPARCEPIDNA